MDVEAVVIIGLRSRQAIDECVGQIIVTLDLASLAVDVGVFLRFNRGFFVVDGELAAVGLRLTAPRTRDLCGRDLRANVRALQSIGRELSFEVRERAIQLVMHRDVRHLIALLAAVVDLVDFLQRDLDLLLDRRDGNRRADGLFTLAALQRDFEGANAVHVQDAGLFADRNVADESRSRHHAPSHHARAVLVIGVVAVVVQLNLVAVVSDVLAVAVHRQAVDRKIRFEVGALSGVLAVHIGDDVVLCQCVSRLDLRAADLVERVVRKAALIIVEQEFRRDLHIAERGVVGVVGRAASEALVLRRHGRERIILRALLGVRRDGERLLRDHERGRNLMRGVVGGFVDVERDNIAARVDRRLLVNIAVRRGVVADGHVARVGEIPVNKFRARVSAQCGVTRLLHGVIGQVSRRSDADFRMRLGDGVDAVGHIARNGVGCLHQIAARICRDIRAPVCTILVLDFHGIVLGACRGDAHVAHRVIHGGCVRQINQGAGLRLCCINLLRIGSILDDLELHRDAALVVVLLRAGNHGVEASLAEILGLFDLRVAVVVEGQGIAFVCFQLVASLIDHLDDLIRRELFALLQLQCAGFAVDLAAADIDWLFVGHRLVDNVVIRVVAVQLHIRNGELILARVRVSEGTGRGGVDAVAVDDANVVRRQARRALIGFGIIQDDLDEVNIRLAVVDLGLCDCVLDVDLTLFDREGELFDLFRPISGSRERDLRGISTGLRRLDKLAVLVVVLDCPGLLGCLIDVAALEVEAVQRHRDALRLAVIGRRLVVDVEVVAALAHDEAAGDLLRHIARVGRCLDRQRVEARLHLLCPGVPLERIPAVDGGLRGEGLFIAGRVALGIVCRDGDIERRIRHRANRAGNQHVHGDRLALGDALKVVAALVGVDGNRDGRLAARRHHDVGIVDLTAIIRILGVNRALIDQLKRALDDRRGRILDGDDRAVGGILLDRVQQKRRPGRAGDVLPTLRSCEIAILLLGHAGQLLPLDGVVLVRVQLGDDIAQVIAQLPIEGIHVGQL